MLAGAVLSMVRLGVTFATVSVAVSVALVVVFSSSWPLTVTTLVTVPASNAVRVV